jgi:acetylornithine deacetylase/succinyl-diaminopimelate desuccinylase-like protein
MDLRTELCDYVEQHREAMLGELTSMINQPSIAAQGLGMTEMAGLLEGRLQSLGARTRQVSHAGGYPVVYGEIDVGAARTLAFYNHYDVQPVDPLDLWVDDPFSGVIRDGRVWGRGTADNKGNLAARICAVEAYLKCYGTLPVNVKFIAEGEEEIGSPTLEGFAEANQDLIQADGCVWEGGFLDETERLVVYCGAKGICYVQLRAKGANMDLHSQYGTMVPNPAWRLTWALSHIKDENERILVPGFYDKVEALTERDKEYIARIPFDKEVWAQRFGIDAFTADLPDLELLTRHLSEPTCTIDGFESGYTSQGMKTIVPSVATANIDFRLVEHQDPHEVYEALEEYLASLGYGDIEIELVAAEKPAKTDLDSLLVRTVVAVAEEFYGEPIVYPTMAGTGPMYVLCQRWGIPSCSAPGVSYRDSRGHAPNENIRVEDYVRAIKGLGQLVYEFSATK